MASGQRSILVTGGAGFIGSHLCERLVAAGDRVVCYDNFDLFYDPAIKRRNISSLRFNALFAVVEADILDQRQLSSAIERFGITHIVHLAALAGVRASFDDPVRYQTVNVCGTTAVLEAAKVYGIRRIVIASSSSVYGQTIRVPFREDDLDVRPISPYAATKLSAENIASVYARTYELDVFCLRFFTVYGPRQRPDMAISKFTARILAGRPIEVYGDGSAKRDFTYVDDIVDGIVAAADSESCRGFQVINLGADRTTQVRDLIELIGAKLGRSPIVDYRPAAMGDVEVTRACIEKARRILDYWPSTRLSDGLAKYIAWIDCGREKESALVDLAAAK